jgi:hypothetical protein
MLRAMRTRLIAALLVASASTVLGGLAFAGGANGAAPAAGPTATAAARTVQETFSPYDEFGERLLDVADYRTASSCSDSYISGQDGPMRCFAGNYIYDPCWPNPNGADEVFCVEAPDATSGVILRDAVSVHEGNDGRPNRAPWALELMDGRVCTFASGATSARGRVRLNYLCDRTRYLWGSPRRTRALWTIRMSRTSTGQGWQRVQIRTAWR